MTKITKALLLALTLSLISALVGFANADSTLLERAPIINDGRETSGTMDEFRLELEENLTAEEKAFVEKVKINAGVHQLNNLVVISLGEKPNPGYGIEFVKQEMIWEQLKIYIKEVKPDPNQMYAQVITFPYLLARVELPPYTTLQIIDADTGKPFVFQGQ